MALFSNPHCAVSLRAVESRNHFKCKWALKLQHLDAFLPQTHPSPASVWGQAGQFSCLWDHEPTIMSTRPVRCQIAAGPVWSPSSRICWVNRNTSWCLVQLYAFITAGKINNNWSGIKWQPLVWREVCWYKINLSSSFLNSVEWAEIGTSGRVIAVLSSWEQEPSKGISRVAEMVWASSCCCFSSLVLWSKSIRWGGEIIDTFSQHCYSGSSLSGNSINFSDLLLLFPCSAL